MANRTKFRGSLALLAGCLLVMSGCAGGSLHAHKRFTTREKALALIDEGKRFEAEGSPLLALERYNRAALVYESPEAYYKMGQIFEAQGKNQEAATAYNKALELAPDYQEARLSTLALGYQPSGAEPTAEEINRAKTWGERRTQEIAVQQTRQQNVETTTTEADLRGQRMEAIESAAQKRLPTTQEVAAVLFAPEAGEAKLPSAEQPVYATSQDVILATYPYHFQQAQQLRKRQLYDRAAEEYERAIQADPKQLDARIELGDMMMRLGRSDRARVIYERAMQDFPQSPVPTFKMGTYYAGQKQPERARALYRKALDLDSKYIEAYNNLAVLDMTEGNTAQAAKLFDEMMKLDPTYANAYLNRGIIASEFEKNKDLALRCYRRYVELNGPRKDQVRSWINELESEE